MKALIPILAAGLLIVPGAALAQGASKVSPGHEMQQNGSKNAPGASYYAPGHEMQRHETTGKTTGASKFAPGHEKKQQNLKDPDRDHDVDTKTRR
jgi:hypothetical protein